MAAPTDRTHRPVPAADALIDGRGHLWLHIVKVAGNWSSRWQHVETGYITSWADLDAGTYGPIWPYRSEDWEQAS